MAAIAGYGGSNGVFAGNAGVSVVDIGDGIGCLALHSEINARMNPMSRAMLSFLWEQLQADSATMQRFDGFVIATDAPNFSVGANLKELLADAQEKRWDKVSSFIETFQAVTQAIKFCPKPGVAAAAGLCLGGGCEICLHSALRQAHAELRTGLVETGVGLLPAAGGCKEMLLHARADAEKVNAAASADSPEVIDAVRGVFETIVLAKLSSTAAEARDLRLLEEADGITLDRDELLQDAKMQVLRLVREGYAAPFMRADIPAPGAAVLADLKRSVSRLREEESISEHDAKVATQVARVLTAGDVTPGTPVSEQHLLELELEAFLSLFSEAKTMERVAYTLTTGKRLKN